MRTNQKLEYSNNNSNLLEIESKIQKFFSKPLAFVKKMISYYFSKEPDSRRSSIEKKVKV